MTSRLIAVAAVVAAFVSLWLSPLASDPHFLWAMGGPAPTQVLETCRGSTCVSVDVPQEDAVYARTAQMLNPTVRIEKQGGNGSGTVIHSSDNGTFILTNQHVATEKGKIVQARFWLVNRSGETVLSVLRDATAVAVDAEHDLALLRLNDSEFRAEAVAAIAPADFRLRAGQDAFAVGAGFGFRVGITQGLITVVKHDLQDTPTATHEHIVSSAAAVPGNSGGGLWVHGPNGYLYVGTTRAIVPMGFGGFVPNVVYSIPNSTLRKFLKANDFGWLA